jgi:5-methylcytosine-specific restriction endonuclease McrA
MKKLSAGKAASEFRREAKTTPPTRDARVALLRRWAEVKAYSKRRKGPRTLSESRAAFRAGFRAARVKVGQCWACSGWADLVRHHVIQLQHNGQNTNANLVKICGECHAAIHPWLPMPSERTQFAPAEDPVPF